MIEDNAAKGFLTEETGKTSFTRVSGLFFALVWLAASAAEIWLATKGESMLAAADRAQGVAFYAFVGAVAPNLLKKLLERGIASLFAAKPTA